MAEERIILTIDDGYCQEKCYCFPIACSAECEHIDKPTFSYTRQEAIECMAKAMASDDVLVEGYYEMAEIALNALLEGK